MNVPAGSSRGLQLTVIVIVLQYLMCASTFALDVIVVGLGYAVSITCDETILQTEANSVSL